MTVVLRRLLNAAAVCWSFFPGTALRAAELTDSELPAVATDSQPNLARAPEARARSRDERWLNKPYHVGLSTILGATPGLDYVFLMPGGELSYALPYVSLAGTLGYLGGINASLAARGRLHLGDAVALTLGPRSALLPLNRLVDARFSRGSRPTSCRARGAQIGRGSLTATAPKRALLPAGGLENPPKCGNVARRGSKLFY